LESPLPHEVIRVADKAHEDLQRRLESDLVVVIYYEGLKKAVGLSVEEPLQTRSVQVFQLLCVVVDLILLADKKYVFAHCVHFLSLMGCSRVFFLGYLLAGRMVEKEAFDAARMQSFFFKKLLVSIGAVAVRSAFEFRHIQQ